MGQNFILIFKKLMIVGAIFSVFQRILLSAFLPIPPPPPIFNNYIHVPARLNSVVSSGTSIHKQPIIIEIWHETEKQYNQRMDAIEIQSRLEKLQKFQAELRRLRHKKVVNLRSHKLTLTIRELGFNFNFNKSSFLKSHPIKELKSYPLIMRNNFFAQSEFDIVP